MDQNGFSVSRTTSSHSSHPHTLHTLTLFTPSHSLHRCEHELPLDSVPSPKELERVLGVRFVMTMASSSHSESVIKYFFYGQNVRALASVCICMCHYSAQLKSIRVHLVLGSKMCIITRTWSSFVSKMCIKHNDLLTG